MSDHDAAQILGFVLFLRLLDVAVVWLQWQGETS